MTEQPTTPEPMEQPDQSAAQDEKSAPITFMDKLTAWYEKFNLFSEIKDEDHWTVMTGKVGLRILGFIVILALSPILLVGLVIAFIFAA